MIIDPDMPDHWKTRMLVDLLGGDEMAPLYLIRLWGHCQNRKKSTFDSLPPAGLKALCRFQGDAQAFNDALVECGFVERDGNALIVCGWDEHNASLVKNWENGKKGGRPRKETPEGNPEETQKKPNDNPGKTQSEPSDNPEETHSGIGLTDREEKRREEKKKTPQTPQGGLRRFDEFWETYPRKTGKENARKAWAKIKPDDSLVNEILNAVRSQTRTDQWQRDGGQYIPHPATWLNGKRWEDEILDPEQSPPGGQFGGGLQVHFGGKS